MTRFELFLQGTQIQVKHDTYLALLYLSVSLFSSRDTMILQPFIVNAEWTNRSLYNIFNTSDDSINKILISAFITDGLS